MANNRQLGHSEKILGGPFSSEKGRDRADARRQIEGLNQNDQVITLLNQINDRLAWMCDFLYQQAAERRSAE